MSESYEKWCVSANLLVPLVDKIAKSARDVCELVRGDKLLVISLTCSVMQPARNRTVLAFRN